MREAHYRKCMTRDRIPRPLTRRWSIPTPLARYRSTDDIVSDLERSRQWLVNHHVAMSVAYVALLYPAWFARGWLSSPWNSAFLLGVLAAAAAGTRDAL
jgi:hypothetical protein